MAEVCTVQGTLINANGQVLAGVGVRAVPVSENGVHVFTAEDELVTHESVATQTNENGVFSINLVRGIECVITIDAMGYAKKVTIPDQPSCLLKDL